MHDVITISDLSANELQCYASLNEAQLKHIYEPARGLFIAESLRVIARALDAGCVMESVLLEEKYLTEEGKANLDEEERTALQRIPEDVPVYTAPLKVLEGITGYKLTRGALSAMFRPDEKTIPEILGRASRIVVFSHITNPTNIGALFRSAAALGADAVILEGGSADPLNRRAIRVSMGTVFTIPWAFADYDSSVPLPDILRRHGFLTIALALTKDSVPLSDPRLIAGERRALFLGSEDDGLSADILSSCDFRATIPMKNGVDSLNVGNAGAVAFYVLLS